MEGTLNVTNFVYTAAYNEYMIETRITFHQAQCHGMFFMAILFFLFVSLSTIIIHLFKTVFFSNDCTSADTIDVRQMTIFTDRSGAVLAQHLVKESKYLMAKLVDIYYHFASLH